MRKITLHVAIVTLALTLGLAGTAAADYTWYSYGGHEYALTLSDKTWIAAEAEAVGLSGHLVTINNEAEQIWLQEHIPNLGDKQPWIGFHWEGPNWVWSSGESVSYIKWGEDQPRSDQTDYNYVLIQKFYGDYTWYNYPSSYYRYGIIERNSAVPLPSAILLLGSGLAGLAAWRRRRG